MRVPLPKSLTMRSRRCRSTRMPFSARWAQLLAGCTYLIGGTHATPCPVFVRVAVSLSSVLSSLIHRSSLINTMSRLYPCTLSWTRIGMSGAHNGQPVSALGFQRPTSTGSGARSAAAATPALKSTGVHAHHHHYHDDRSNTGSGSGSGSHRKSQTSVSVGIASTEGAPSSPLMSTAHTPPRTMSRKVKEKSSRSPKSQRSAERAAAAAAEEEEALAVAAAANVSSALPPPPSSSQSERSPPRRRGDDPSGASSPAVLPPTPSMGDTPPITVTGKASLTPAASHDAGWSQQSLGSLAGKGSGSGSSVWGHTSSPWGAGAHRVSGRPSPGPVLYAPTDVDEEAVGGVNMSGLEVERGEDELPISNRVFQEAMLGLR